MDGTERTTVGEGADALPPSTQQDMLDHTASATRNATPGSQGGAVRVCCRSLFDASRSTEIGTPRSRGVGPLVPLPASAPPLPAAATIVAACFTMCGDTGIVSCGAPSRSTSSARCASAFPPWLSQHDPGQTSACQGAGPRCVYAGTAGLLPSDGADFRSFHGM